MTTERPETTSSAPAGDPPGGAAGVTPGAAPADRRRRRLASYSVQNMVWSTLAVGVVVLAWWALTLNPEESQRRPPEVTQTAAYVVEQAPWPVWVPEPGEEWVPTVVSYDPLEGVQTWHISYTSPEGEYVALHQAADVTDAWLAAVLGDSASAGEAELEGPGGAATWQAWEGSPGSNAERGYLLGPQDTGGSTAVVHGTATEEELRQFLDVVEARD
ncbi:DUF4245 domain-containing protein [Ornithinimicrobium cerasi]|uniref:DUF4245 domain-containing protein n=1 Tax=Ornithinimicrobium cerasi TaxID=2248773 RepID=A0A285VUZ8_9MICO|nr:DUF4245 domain-containing protein [Ornithinimicrobium cerasi]SOC57783.1 Protein of unknown function [Ornithinimicrobium cerasi]